MKTNRKIKYRTAFYSTTIPKGTRVVKATNLPEPGQYWAEPWQGMSENDRSWMRNYGFRILHDEVD